MPIDSVLAKIPGYGGYAARRAQIEEGDTREIAQAGVLQQLHQRQQEAQEIQQMKGVVAQAGSDPARAVEALLKHGTSKSIELATKLKALMPKPAEPYTLAPGGQRRGADDTLLAEAPMRPEASPEIIILQGAAAKLPQGNPVREQIEARIAKLTTLGGENGVNPYFTFISTPQGIIAGNARTGTAAPVTVDDRRPMKAPDDPRNRGAIAAAVTAGQEEAKRAFNMAGIGATLKQAEDILLGRDPETGRPVTKPTGSGVGSLYDAAAGFIGASPAGSKQAQALKVVAGSLVTKMPRMEGPQSDRDVQLYREMAAQIGDDTIPIDRRVQALEVVKNLWSKYEKLNPDAFSGGAASVAAPEGVPADVWAVMTPEERALWQK